MFKEYKYQCKDASLLTPAFKKVVVSPLMLFIPYSLPANIITLASNCFLYLAVILALLHQTQNKFDFVAIPILILLYAIGDHMDGMQAKKTKTGSPLGEFCDHYLDVFNNAILLFLVLTLYGVENSITWVVLVLTSYLAHAAVIYEQYKTGWLVFEKFGSLEAVFLSIFIIFLGFFSTPFNLLTYTLSTFKIIELLMLISSLGAIFTALKINRRVDNFSPKFYMFAISLFVIGFVSFYLNTFIITFIIVTLYCAYYIGNLMRAHLIDDKERFPDIAVPIMLVYLSYIYGQKASLSASYIIIYEIIIICILVVKTIYPIREFWVWKNKQL